LKKIAVIDVGTNSVLALVINSESKTEFNKYHITELGKGFKDNMLKEERIEYTFQTVANFIHQVRNYNCEQIIITGTSASRDAKNIDRLANRIYDNFGIKYSILSGELEAYYTFLGAVSLFPKNKKNYLMMDIGGGSTELIIGNHFDILFKKSYPIGAVRLFNQFSQKTNFTDGDINEIGLYIDQELKDFKIDVPIEKFVGIGGTFTTAATISKRMTQYDENLINQSNINLEQLDIMFNNLNRIPLEDRKEIQGMEEKRAPYILYGSLIYLKFMKRFKLNSVQITDRGLRYGLAFEHLKISNKQFDKHSE
jgi:exopolyphosphatase / guanosine-5'-triphosphate,3'-diphosphate pyrophosphatase